MDTVSVVSFVILMLALAALPSTSVVFVVTRAATHGVPNGIAAACGIALGDLVFVATALLGMSLIAESLGALFAVVKYVGGAYLVWLGLALLRSGKASLNTPSTAKPSSLLTSVVAGLVVTLGDIKAILFYASLFPNLFDLVALSSAEVALIFCLTFITVAGAKAVYAIAARRLMSRLANSSTQPRARKALGGVLIGTGVWVAIKT